MINPWHFEPVAIGVAIRASLLCAVTFGFELTADQIGAIMLAAEAIMGVFTRQSVTSTNTIHQAGLTVNKIEAAAAANVATGKAE